MMKQSCSSDISAAKALQQELRSKVTLCPLIQGIKRVGGTDVAYKDEGRTTRAVFVVLSFPGLELLDQAVVEQVTSFPYIPGYLSFRELPALLVAYKKLSILPDVVLCDGQGIAHPRRFGLACHLGVVLDLPAIGVAKKRFVGEYHEPGLNKGEKSPLLDENEQLGWVLRSRTNVKPVFVNPGHKADNSSCADFVLQCCTKTRLPEPTRIADRISKQK